MQVREAEGVSAERLGRIGPVLRAEVDKGTFPGAVSLVARNGRVVHFEATGYLDAAKTKPMTKDTIFRLASMTKPLVSVAAMMLVEQGVMKINDPISNWLPELKDLKFETAAGDVAPARAVTVQDLLRHTAGMVGTAEDYLKFLQMMANGGEYAGRRYLSKKTVEFMLSDHTPGMGGTTFASTGPGYGFGLGFAVRAQDGFAWTPGSKGDAMWAGAWGTSFWIDPKEKLVGLLMTQSPSNRVQTRMLFKNLVYAAVVE